MTTTAPDHDRFDQAARGAHAAALAHVSAGTLAQLHRRRHAALSTPAARGLRWRLPAAAFASLLVVATGLGVALRTTGEAPATPGEPVIASLEPATGVEGALDDLDQNPEFYAWLASGDADLIAME